MFQRLQIFLCCVKNKKSQQVEKQWSLWKPIDLIRFSFLYLNYTLIVQILLCAFWNILKLLFLAGVSTPRGPNSLWRNSIEGVALSSWKAEEGLCQSPVDTLTPHQSAFQSCRLFPSVPTEEAVVSFFFVLDKKPQAGPFICSCVWFPYKWYYLSIA